MSGLITQTGGGVLTQQTLAALNLIAAGVFPTQGNIFFVDLATGSDADPGTASQPFATLQAALAAATPNQNDIIYLCASGNTAGLTTQYQTATLNWNKNAVHLIGINASPQLSQRSRIAWTSGYVGTSNLFTVSANGCVIWNIEFFAGVASANPIGGVLVTGARNHFINCHIAGIGNTSMDIAGAYSLCLSGAEECVFDDCTIGLDTVALSAGANSQLLIQANAGVSCTRNAFRNCLFLNYAAHATNPLFIRAAATTIDRWMRFHNCMFINPVDSAATALTHAVSIAAAVGGTVLLTGADFGYVGATNWNATSAADVRAATGVAPDATAFGKAVLITSNG